MNSSLRKTLASVAWPCLALVALLAAPSAAQTPPAADEARVIVKYKADSPLLRRQALAAGDQRADAARRLAGASGSCCEPAPTSADRTQVVFAQPE